jgi:DNA-binding response OmpR family regulator
LREALYGYDDDVGSNTVEVHIHGLRRKLGRGIVQTLRGFGYRIGSGP